ncbi:MAG: PilT/PilU family type 4a pilus ATPase [Candidatus Omnitrophica bacterium]|nr:PilT/PilU family type 4a pilus ATPase [Candidatus Omnitrophota bacterium]
MIEPKAYLSAVLGKVLEMKGLDLFLKVGSVPRTRIGGVVTPMDFPVVKEEDTKAIVENICNNYQKGLLEKNRSVDFAFSLIGTERRFRANVFFQQATYSLVIRTLWHRIPSFEELNIPPILKQMALERSGMILIAGTVASGKTTTISAMIDMMNSSVDRHIITIEDPVEYLHQDRKCIINQREIGIDANDFNSALKYVVRQSPDAVVIGEMRDAETFNFALASAEVGRLVIATVHAKTVVQIFDRVLGFFPPAERDQVLSHLSFNITCFAAQKLLVAKDGRSLVPVFEIMIGNYTIRQLVREKKFDRIAQALRNAANEGMQTFDDSIFKVWKDGKISTEEALRASDRPQEMENQMKGIKIDGQSGRILGT